MGKDIVRVAAVQASPVWLDTEKTTEKIVAFIEKAASDGVQIIVFPETFLPGYPFWVCRTNGSEFNSNDQKRAYSQYLDAAVEVPSKLINTIVKAVRKHGVFCYLGVAERGRNAGRGTVYCSLLAIDPCDGIVNVHRKLMPTFDERLVWGQGDGHGLRTQQVGPATIGGLNCWENWMPLARYTLYSEGMDIHAGVWPGISDMHAEAMRHIAREGRVWCIAASGLLYVRDIPKSFIFYDRLSANPAECLFDGGSAIIAPDGEYVAGPVIGEECLVVADIDLGRVREERQNFDPTGHYSRADVFQLKVDDSRQESVRLKSTEQTKIT